MKIPCKDCKERHLKCHSECEKYQEWNKEHQKYLEKKAKEKTAQGIVDQFMIDNSAKRKKLKGVRGE